MVLHQNTVFTYIQSCGGGGVCVHVCVYKCMEVRRWFTGAGFLLSHVGSKNQIQVIISPGNKCLYHHPHPIIKIFEKIYWFFYLCAWASCPHVCLYTTCVPGTQEGWGGASYSLLQMVVSYHVDARKWTQVRCKSTLNCQAISAILKYRLGCPRVHGPLASASSAYLLVVSRHNQLSAGSIEEQNTEQTCQRLRPRQIGFCTKISCMAVQRDRPFAYRSGCA